MKNIITSAVCAIYLAVIMLPVTFMMLIFPFFTISEINKVRISGFATAGTMVMLSGFGLFIGLSLLIPALRRMYSWFPWFFPFVKIFFINMAISVIALEIINFGYRVQNLTRHTTFFILMLCAIIVGRGLMSFYFHHKNVEHIEGGGR